MVLWQHRCLPKMERAQIRRNEKKSTGREKTKKQIKKANTYNGKKCVCERERGISNRLLFLFCFLLQNKTGSLIFEIGCYVQNTIKIDA